MKSRSETRHTTIFTRDRGTFGLVPPTFLIRLGEVRVRTTKQNVRVFLEGEVERRARAAGVELNRLESHSKRPGKAGGAASLMHRAAVESHVRWGDLKMGAAVRRCCGCSASGECGGRSGWRSTVEEHHRMSDFARGKDDLGP